MLHRASLFTEQAFAQRSPCTEKLLHKASSYTEKLLHREAFTQSKLLHREALTHSKLLHREAFTQSKLLHREAYTQQQRSFYTKQAFTQRSCYTGCAQNEKYLLPKHHSQPSWSHYILQFTVLSLQKTFYKSILHAAAAARNLDAAIPRRSAETELHNTQ